MILTAHLRSAISAMQNKVTFFSSYPSSQSRHHHQDYNIHSFTFIHKDPKGSNSSVPCMESKNVTRASMKHCPVTIHRTCYYVFIVSRQGTRANRVLVRKTFSHTRVSNKTCRYVHSIKERDQSKQSAGTGFIFLQASEQQYLPLETS